MTKAHRSHLLRVLSLEDRITPAVGDLNPLFGGGDGLLNLPLLLGATPGQASAVATTSSGDVFTVGEPTGTILPLLSEVQFSVTKTNSSGVPDTSFDSDGTAIIGGFGLGLLPGLLGSRGMAADVAVQSDGKVVVAATLESTVVLGTSTQVVVFRLNTDGSLDTTFDTDGRVFFDFSGSGGDSQAAGVQVLPDGRILVTGTDAKNFAAAVLTTNGSFDPTFSGDGKNVIDVPGDG